MNWDYFYSFFQSHLLELPIYVYIYHTASKGAVRGAWVALFSNAITHPIVFFGFMGSGLTYLTSILLAEAFAISAETGLHSYFGRLKLSKALLAAALANYVSWQLAPLLTYWFWF